MLHSSKICLVGLIFLVQTLPLFSQDFTLSEFELIRLPGQINSSFEESKPILNQGGDSLFFIRSFHPENMGGEEAGQDIWLCKKENDEWTVPINKLAELNSVGSNLIIGYTYHQNLYSLKYKFENETRYAIVCVSDNKNEKWSEPVPIDLPPVKVGDGYHDFYVHSSEKVILVSRRNIDSLGEEDLYIIYKNEKDEWMGPFNLGSTVNTRGFEISPFLSEDGKTLYFSSNGRDGYGNADIWKSERRSDNWLDWGAPVNLGSLINSIGFDAYFYLPSDDEAYFVSNKNSGKTDIYHVRKKQTDPQNLAVEIENEVQGEPLKLTVYFDFDQFDITTETEQKIRSFCQGLPIKEINKIDVMGYTDLTGTARYNKKLSKKRANEISHFMENLGLDDLDIYSYGNGIWPDPDVSEQEMRQVTILVYLGE